jgi:hypothetical protein
MAIKTLQKHITFNSVKFFLVVFGYTYIYSQPENGWHKYRQATDILPDCLLVTCSVTSNEEGHMPLSHLRLIVPPRREIITNN